MSNEICHRDQYKIYQIFEQVKVLSDIVDELRIEINNLKNSLDMNQKNIICESTEGNSKNDIKPSILQKMKKYFKNIVTITEKPCQSSKDSQAHTHCSLKFDSTSANYIHCKRENDKRRYRSLAISSSTVYEGLKSFKNKIVQAVRNIQVSQRSPNLKHRSMIANQQQPTYLPRKEKKTMSSKYTKKKNDISKCKITEELDNSSDISFKSDVSPRTEIITCSWQKGVEESLNFNHTNLTFPCRNVTNSIQTSPLSMINNNQAMICSSRFTSDLGKNHMKQTFLKDKLIKYRKCSCKDQCPYALYKLPCNKPHKRVENETSGLTFNDETNLPEFVNAVAEQKENDKYLADFSSTKREEKSSISSLSVDLEVNICSNYTSAGNINEYSKRRKARTYIVNKITARKNGNLFNNSESSKEIQNEFKDVDEKVKNIGKMVQSITGQKKYLYPQTDQRECQTKTEYITNNYRPIRNNNKRIQCDISAFRTTTTNRKMSIKTSTTDLRQCNIVDQSYRSRIAFAHDEARYTNFPKIIIPRRLKKNTQTQTDQCLNFNCQESICSTVISDYCTKENKRIAKEIDTGGTYNFSPSQVIWPRTERCDVYPALQTEENVDIYSKKYLGQTCDINFGYWQNNIIPVETTHSPYHYNHISNERCKKLITLMSYLTDYHSPSKGVADDFDMSSVSGRLYGCIKKLGDISA